MKAVFFDWDGTLVDSLPLLFAAHNHVRANMGLPLWTREEYAEAIVYSTRELYPKIYGEKSEEAQEMLYSYVQENHLKELILIEGAREVLEYLAEKSVPMGLVSNKRHDVLRREVEHLGWQKFFGVYNGAGAAPRDKPSGEPILYAIGLHPDKPDIGNVIYVGDTESDLSAAKEAGCPVIFIRHGKDAEALISLYKPAYVVDSLAELKEVLIKTL
ncbi:MAG: HAD family hydrolase [Micavibrio aeruginosavorus]|uniref:phosphoglycolate phosphatase n=1 Tax=Micavibrio aeruginosavorus TaxID=349221 RepID=A0A2W5Q9F5_9BACT|nr:MAG: HAD family hydrolase [Micavibrio aeruginosavorus]